MRTSIGALIAKVELVSALIRDPTELPGSFRHVRPQKEGGSLQPGRKPSPEPDCAGIPTLLGSLALPFHIHWGSEVKLRRSPTEPDLRPQKSRTLEPVQMEI